MEFFDGRRGEVPALRIGGSKGERIRALPLPWMREDVLPLDLECHVVEEARRRQVQADGQWMQAQGDIRRRRHFYPGRLCVEDEGSIRPREMSNVFVNSPVKFLYIQSFLNYFS